MAFVFLDLLRENTMRTITGSTPISVATLREFLHIDHTDEHSQLARCIDAGVDYVERETNRDILIGSVVQMSYACGAITLSRSPVASVESVTSTKTDPVQHQLISRVEARSAIVITDPQPDDLLTITYTTGMASPRPLVVQACLWAAAHFYLNREPEVVGTITSQFKSGLLRIMTRLKAGGYA